MLINVNVGVLGHVDSGKTTLSKALSTVASTAAFDKNPQSQRRGITLDLGFSSFKVDKNIPPHLAPSDSIQITLVDCPGHASLIRTIICGTHIIDLMLLVVDVNKGFQTQTSECLVIGELTCDTLVVVLTKVDLIPPEQRDEKIAKMKSRVSRTLQPTKFAGAPIVAVSALQNVEASTGGGMEELISTLLNSTPDPRERRSELADLPFLFAVDHCFSKSGQGTVLTGTVLRGHICVGETVEIPRVKLKKKIKSIQMFRNSVEEIGPGDRAGICVTQLDPGVMERGYLASPDSLSACHACLLTGVARIVYYKGAVRSNQRFHVSIGQDTVLARITCLRRVGGKKETEEGEFEYIEELCSEGGADKAREMVLEFDAPVVAPMDGVVIGSRLDTDPLSSSCRLAFHGTVARFFESSQECRASLSVYRCKQRRGEVERVIDPRSCIVRGLFKGETNWELFTGLTVTVILPPSFASVTTEGDNVNSIRAVIEGSFGRAGKCRIRLFADLPDVLVKRFSGKAGKKLAKETASTDTANSNTDTVTNTLDGHLAVTLDFKKHVFDTTKRFFQ